MAAVTNGEYASRLRRKYGVEDELNRYVSALYEMLAGAIGQEKLVLRAGKVSALKMMRSQSLPDRLCALARLVFEDPTLERATTRAQQRKTIAEIEEAMADLLAHKSVGDAIDKKVSREDERAPPGVSQGSQAGSAARRFGSRNAGNSSQTRRTRSALATKPCSVGVTATAPAAAGRDRRSRECDQSAGGQDQLALSGARDPLRSARRRKDDRRAPGARAGKVARLYAVCKRRAVRRDKRHDVALGSARNDQSAAG